MATDVADDLQLDPVNDYVIDALATSTGSDICDDANQYASDEQTYHYYGARELAAFHNWYQNYHGYVATIVCVFGIIANAVNIVVLTRRNMISATNSILTGLAVADGLTMAVYLPFALRFYVLYGTATSPERNSFEAVCFMMFYASFSVVVHTAAIWLTVVLAVFRYVFIRYPRHGAEWCSLARSKLAIALVFLFTLIVCIPNLITMTLIAEPASLYDDESGLQTLITSSRCPKNTTYADVVTSPTTTTTTTSADFYVDDSELSLTTSFANGNATEKPMMIWNVGFKNDTTTDIFIQTFNFWIQALLVKLTPCVGLTVLSLLLVQTMKEAEARRQNLRNGAQSRAKATVPDSSNSPGADHTATRKRNETTAGHAAGGGGGGNRERKTNRTTRMLLVVVVLFLVTEFPQGVFNLLCGVLEHFIVEVYIMLGDLLDILALINNGINFILYCTMSKQFRDTFVRCFHLQPVVDACCRTAATQQSSAANNGGNRKTSNRRQRASPGCGYKASAMAGASDPDGSWRKEQHSSDGAGQTTALLSPEANGNGNGNTVQISMSAVEPTISACSCSGEA